MPATKPYRWNHARAAEDYDAAAPEIHPLYREVQDAVLAALPFPTDRPIDVLDLGGGSGRLLERLLERRPGARATLLDPSEPFLELARRRLERFGDRLSVVHARAQDAWPEAGPRYDAIVSTSALHHLDAAEKTAVFRRCRSAVAEGGVFVNGDEYRPASDADYRRLLEAWGEHMAARLAAGAIPESFDALLAKWRERNLDGFGGPRESGDDCHETVEEQTAKLYGAGFSSVRTPWSDRLWAVLLAAR